MGGCSYTGNAGGATLIDTATWAAAAPLRSEIMTAHAARNVLRRAALRLLAHMNRFPCLSPGARAQVPEASGGSPRLRLHPRGFSDSGRRSRRSRASLARATSG